MTAGDRKKEREKALQLDNSVAGSSDVVGLARGSLERAQDNPITMQEIADKVETAFRDWSQANGVRDWTKETQRRFSAVCLYIGDTIFKPNRKDLLVNPALRITGSATATTSNRIDVDTLASLYDLFLSYSIRCDKCPTRWAFQFFAGLSHDYLGKMGNNENATPSALELYKKIITNEESTNMDSLLGGRQNVVGVIFAGKNLYGWRDVKEVAHTTDTRRTMEDIAVSMGLGLPDSGNDGN